MEQGYTWPNRLQVTLYVNMVLSPSLYKIESKDHGRIVFRIDFKSLIKTTELKHENSAVHEKLLINQNNVYTTKR